MTTIAAIIPLHNKGPFIERALQSALSQPVDEIIVVDDVSSDDGAARVAACHDPRIRLLKRGTPGPGGYAARNLAIERARSDWIAFLDADDEWAPDYIETMRKAIAAHPEIGAAYASRLIVGSPKGDFVQTSSDRDIGAHDFDGFLDLWLRLGRCPVWTSASLFRRDVLMSAGLFPAGRCKRGGDKDMWLRAMHQTKALASPIVGATYHFDTGNQVTRQTSVNTRHCMCSTLNDLIAASDGERRRKLKRVANLEMRDYATKLFGREPLSRDVFRDFYADESPALYAALWAVSITPLPVQRWVRNSLKGAASA
ncbi:MAG TPA: glycosyltransferase family A protein [Caulobacterales bacterium]|nr:glycosyltransferase family A protein [Caulobacterales bacterium]